MGKDKRKLKNFLINPSLQLRYIFLHFWAGTGIVAFNLWSFRKFGSDTGMDQIPAFNEQLSHSITMTAIMSLVLVALFAVICAIASHRTAGPIYHIRKVINEIRAGNLSARARVRKNDDFQDLATSLNELLDELLRKAK